MCDRNLPRATRRPRRDRRARVLAATPARRLLPLALLFALSAPHEVHAQDLPAAIVGGAVGMVGGAYVSLGLVVARARMGHYIHDPGDIFGWNSLPIALGAAAGASIGFLDPERLRHTVLAGAASGILGGAAGTLIGHLIWEGPEGRWAGFAIGAGSALAAGAVIGFLLPADSERVDDGRSAAAVVPLSIRIRL